MFRFRSSVIFSAVLGIVCPLFSQNDKQVLGNPVMTPEEIQAGGAIIYLIRFQNVWQDTVRQIVIRDTLDPRLDPATFLTLDASHDYQLLGEGGSEIRWYFEDIQLPDSASGGANSIGYVLFSVRPRKFLSPGQSIVNRACIFFDDSLSVCTNEAIVLIDDGAGAKDISDEKDEYRVVPNPNYGQFEVRPAETHAASAASGAQCWITDIRGRNVWSGFAGDISQAGRQIWLEKPVPGHYLLWIKTEKRLQIEQFTIAR